MRGGSEYRVLATAMAVVADLPGLVTSAHQVPPRAIWALLCMQSDV